eukprot:2456299-Prymnesium_polylepis.2
MDLGRLGLLMQRGQPILQAQTYRNPLFGSVGAPAPAGTMDPKLLLQRVACATAGEMTQPL